MSTGKERIRALLVGSAARSVTGYTSPVEQRWVEAIRRQADLDHLSIMQVVNEAFRRYFEST